MYSSIVFVLVSVLILITITVAEKDTIILGHGGDSGHHCHLEHHGHKSESKGIILKSKKHTIILGHHGKNVIVDHNGDKIVFRRKRTPLVAPPTIAAYDTYKRQSNRI